MVKPVKIISGGQTGADRGALDAAIKLNIPHGGACPKGRKAEDGIIPFTYELTETRTSAYDERTELNVLHSDATLIFTRGKMTPGSTLTHWLAKQYGKPCFVADILSPTVVGAVEAWLAKINPVVLNVAGTRESKARGIGAAVCAVMVAVLARRASSFRPPA